MNFKTYNQSGKETGSVDLPDAIFGVKMNTDLVSQVISVHRANSRSVLAHTKGRGEVRGGGKKPWKQKGTGRARHASIRSPIWVGGGVAFGPTKERNFSRRIPKTMARQALFMTLSSKVKDGELIVLDELVFKDAKTKQAAEMLKSLKTRGSVFLVTSKKEREIERAIQNIPRVEITAASNLNAYDILANKNLIMTRDSIPVLESVFLK